MKKEYITPPGSPTPKGYNHVVAVDGGRMIFLAGQVAFDADRNIVGKGDLVAQIHQCIRNIQSAAEAGGGKLSDVVKLTTFVVDYEPDQLEGIAQAITDSFPAGELPTNTLIGVDSLSTPGLLVEIGAFVVAEARAG